MATVMNIQPGARIDFLNEAFPQGKRCADCDCLESDHADEDYDCVGDPPRYVADPRPCLKCACKDFWEG